MTVSQNDVRASASVTQLEAEGLVDARVSPLGSLENLSQREVQQLLSSGHGGVYEMFRRCALAVLASGLESDDVRAIFDRYKDFEIRLGRPREHNLLIINACVFALIIPLRWGFGGGTAAPEITTLCWRCWARSAHHRQHKEKAIRTQAIGEAR